MNADYSNELWQRMLTLVNQHPHSGQSNLKQIEMKIAWQRFFSENALVFLLQYIGLSLISLSSQPYPLWFASGTACAFLFLRGGTVLPGLTLASFLAYLAAHANITTALTSALILSFQAYALLWINYRLGNVNLTFYRLSTFMPFLISSALLILMTTTLLFIVCTHQLSIGGNLWLQWCLANFNGVIVISCAVLTWDAYFTEMHRVKKRSILLFSLLVVSCLAFLFQPSAGVCVFTLAYVISFWLGWRGAMAALFTSACAITFGLMLVTPSSMTSSLTIFFTALSVTSLMLSFKSTTAKIDLSHLQSA